MNPHSEKLTDYLTKLFSGDEKSYEELVSAFKPHGAAIKEANEWRPLADHVLALLEAARLEGAQAALKKAVRTCEDARDSRLDPTLYDEGAVPAHQKARADGCHLCAFEIRSIDLAKI